MKFTALVLVLSVLALGIVPEAFSYGLDFSQCPQVCYIYNHGADQPVFQNGATPNWSMDVIMPDYTCNINGKVQLNGRCSTPEIVLSQDNFTAFKNNIAVKAVLDIHTTNDVPPMNYCPLALYTWNHQDGYANKTAGFEDLVIPKYCASEITIPVPEFNAGAGIALLLMVVSAIAVTKFAKIKYGTK